MVFYVTCECGPRKNPRETRGFAGLYEDSYLEISLIPNRLAVEDRRLMGEPNKRQPTLALQQERRPLGGRKNPAIPFQRVPPWRQ